MEIAGVRPGKSEFWERQFSGRPTWKKLAFDVAFGVVGPVGCLIADPVVFQPMDWRCTECCRTSGCSPTW